MKKINVPRRGGLTLLELLIAISLSATIALLAIVFLHSVMVLYTKNVSINRTELELRYIRDFVASTFSAAGADTGTGNGKAIVHYDLLAEDGALAGAGSNGGMGVRFALTKQNISLAVGYAAFLVVPTNAGNQGTAELRYYASAPDPASSLSDRMSVINDSARYRVISRDVEAAARYVSGEPLAFSQDPRSAQSVDLLRVNLHIRATGYANYLSGKDQTGFNAFFASNASVAPKSEVTRPVGVNGAVKKSETPLRPATPTPTPKPTPTPTPKPTPTPTPKPTPTPTPKPSPTPTPIPKATPTPTPKPKPLD